MDLPINGAARDEIARILEQVAKEGLSSIDAAIDAIGTALQAEEIMKCNDMSGESYYVSGHDVQDARDSFGIGVDIFKGYFVAVSE